MGNPQVPATAALWTSTTTNTKTGDVPTLWIGTTRAESLASCDGCPLRPESGGGDGSCYAQGGTPSLAHHSMISALKRGKDYSLRQALKAAKRSAKMARFGAIGDPGALPKAYLSKAIAAVKAMGLDVVGYTHHWRVKPHLAGVFMASCDDVSEVDSALAAGFRAAVVLPWDHEGKFTTPKGATGIVCPAMVSDRVTCNTCRLCDGSKPGPVIGFPDHGPKYNHKRRAAKAAKPTPSTILDSLDI